MQPTYATVPGAPTASSFPHIPYGSAVAPGGGLLHPTPPQGQPYAPYGMQPQPLAAPPPPQGMPIGQAPAHPHMIPQITAHPQYGQTTYPTQQQPQQMPLQMPMGQPMPTALSDAGASSDGIRFDSGHQGVIHDAQLDFYGRRLATASSDQTIRIFSIGGEAGGQSLDCELHGHQGPVWAVSWAHPKYGSLLASGGYDKRVIVWKQKSQDNWIIIHKADDHSAAVNSVTFAPWEMGLHLATASSDGTAAVYSHQKSGQWLRRAVTAHAGGVTTISWSPPVESLSLLSSGTAAAQSASHVPAGMQPLTFATGGCDNLVKIWMLDQSTNEIVEKAVLGLKTVKSAEGAPAGHTQWVRDVAWRPSVGLPTLTVASCSEDRSVIIWTQEVDNSPWVATQIVELEDPVWRVSWSITGTTLAAACGDSRIVIFQENGEGTWVRVGERKG